ncbi:hypothetical protein AWC05_22820 [Mycobacterium florentinum]|uniref:Uncharacterized protein n=1 Tax=Mycobacterium florentinum TaxID=292462 RepID=A0A1X1U6B5_MYCFL|nr:hypothetical protein [Mycobacterium florentinum]MCV7410024.1 hypothetical protein [Mycobacterium florentinum]ORV52343.1 hypothetical protein AWC05_22820 [Mycobacterium florentinum]BBX79330.1 hypothetical protein MFLOJ_31170 [Mycobacterium florentinum]
MKVRGSQVFADELARFAAGCDDERVSAIAANVAAPLRAAVRGRAGVGRGTVARALAHAAPASGITVMPADGEADLVVQVIAEVVKPEDADAIATAGRPVLTVLNKADLAGRLSGRTADGPLASARTRCAHLAELTGVAVEPMIALLTVAAFEGLDAASWGALRTLAAHPACLQGSFGEFVAADNPVPAQARLRLLDTLDLFGTALGMAAVRRGGTLPQLRALLRRVSGVDAVIARLSALGAEARYRRVLEATAELEALAVGGSPVGERVGGFLSRDDTVIARMAGAVEMAEAAGHQVGDCHDPAGHLPRAARWQRHSRGSASDLHRACGVDITRGSLRLWSKTRESS